MVFGQQDSEGLVLADSVNEFSCRPDAHRTAPPASLWTHQKGGFHHDGRFATLDEVVGHYDSRFNLGLT